MSGINYYFFSIISIVLVGDELLLANGVGINSDFVREFVYYAIGYGLIFLLGLRYNSLSKEIKGAALGVVAICYAIMQIRDNMLWGGDFNK